MNKKYLSVVLFGALLAASAGTFTSCKDYDDDIKGLQEQIDKNGSTVSDLQTQLATLKAAADAAQAAADAAKTAATEAKTAADAAKAAGDQAKADAATALATAKAAEAAAAQAKADAIAEATKLVESLRNSMQAAIDKKLDITAFEEASKLLGARIDGIESGLSNLKNGAVKENADAIKTAQDAIEALQSADVDFAKTLKQLDEYVKNTLEANIETNTEDIKTAQGDIKNAQKEIADLWKKISGGEGSLEDLISKNATAISDLKDAIEDELDAIKGDIKKIQADIKKINGQITAINQNLAGLHTLVTCRLTSISFAPDYIVDGVEAIKFSSLKYSGMDKNENAGIPTTYKFSTAALATASYHFNPASFKLANADYSYIDRTATVINTRAAASKWVEISGEPVANAVAGTVDFKLLRLNAHSTQPEMSDVNMIALQATLKDKAVDKDETGVVVTSPYVSIYDDILDASDVRIADDATLTEFGADAHYATTFDACKAEAPRYKMYYNEVFNLKDLVATCFGDRTEINIHRKFPIEDYNLSYRFDIATTAYNIVTGSTTTNQQKWIKCNDAVEGLYQAEDFSREAIGRTPILKVELVDANGNVVRRGFVKVEIGVEKSDDMTLPMTLKKLTYNCATTAATYEMSEEYIRENLYRKIANSLGQVGMSHEEFWNLYDASTATTAVTKNGSAYGMSAPRIVDGPTSAGVSTKKIVWSFKHGELGKINSASTFVASITVKNKLVSSEYPATVTFQFSIDVTLPTLTEKLVKNTPYWTLAGTSADDFDVNVTVPNDDDEVSENCQFSQDLEAAYIEHTVSISACIADEYYEVIETRSNGTATPIVLSGVKIDGTVISLDKNDAVVKKALNTEGGLQAVVKHVYRLESGDELSQHSFVVNFIRPVNLNMPGDVILHDAKTGGDVANFQHNKLLTDWRGEAITAPYQVPVTGSVSYWDFKYTPKYEYVDGHYELEQEAKLNVITKEVSFTAAKPVTMYTVSETYAYSKWERVPGTIRWDWVEKDRATFTAMAETPADAETAIRAQLLEKGWGNSYTTKVDQVGPTETTTNIVLEGELVKYTYVAGIEYTPAKYKWHEGDWVEVKHEHSDYPNFNGSVDGETAGCGCYVWTTYTETTDQYVAGHLWNFYGPFGEVTLNINEVSTDLPNKKLPADATLVQEGNTVKYININSPVGSEYKIFIPATVTYGWGTATSQLTITVKPVK